LNIDGFDFTVNPGVYQPSDDTYLLLESIALTKADSFLEIGCGAGLVTMAAAIQGATIVATDISMNAVKNTIQNLEINALSHHVSVFQSDLLTAVQANSGFDVIAFNPPYLPQDGYSSSLDQATIGGPKGIEISERFLSQAVSHLNQGGRVYLVGSTLANITRLQSTMETIGLELRITASKKLFYEELHIFEGRLLKNHTETVL
jgi:release factor glutamine methyltransferase